ncbi:MAG: threonine synthase [Clostridia bacterium]|nr:threonine synthase [Clostridia bacterium]
MEYVSTRGAEERVTFSQAVVKGLAPDGGLFVPCEDVVFPKKALAEMAGFDYQGLALAVMSRYADDFSEDELKACIEGAYGSGRFPECPVNVTRAGKNLSILELWHGPTCAFKDMALQILPRFMVAASRKCGEEREITILTATSGDTGKAALEGFRDVPGIKVMVFYPAFGVSETQKLQMITQEGSNVCVKAIYGNFDDAQTGVKKIFGDAEFAEKLAKDGKMLSSANSINWGRLLPQIVYYFFAYFSLVREKAIKLGEKADFCVPTGNFGDILACYYAKKSGLPVGKIICACNTNSVVADFLATGTYDKNRPFVTTSSPAMDILVSSNLERLIYDACGKDPVKTAGFMRELAENGRYTVGKEILDRIHEDFESGFATEEQTKAAIAEAYFKDGILIDPHTAVGYSVLAKKRSGSTGNQTVLVSTASPFKFNSSVAEALCPADVHENMSEEDISRIISEKTGESIPAPLIGLSSRKIRFPDTVEPEKMKQTAEEFIYG